MSSRHPTRFLAGLVLEVAALAVGVSLLPRFAAHGTGDVSQAQFADQPPTLMEPQPQPGPGVHFGQRPTMIESDSPPPADPAYVERRLDQAGQQLLSGVASYLSRTASELLQPAPPVPADAFSPPANAYRY